MKKMFLFFLFILTSCTTTKYVTIPLTKAPDFYKAPETNSITTIKDLVSEYRRSMMKISEWQNWYVVQTNDKIGNTNK